MAATNEVTKPRFVVGSSDGFEFIVPDEAECPEAVREASNHALKAYDALQHATADLRAAKALGCWACE
jgi:hypothetical protein